jgi:UDP-N-acetylglucosamine diphosphorylase/glucosamine-1-phosphate N-acetyltransferase
MAVTQILIYDDEIARSRRFLPLTYTRPVAAMRSGAFSGIERVRARYPGASIHLACPARLADVSRERYDVKVNESIHGEVMLLNSREILQPADSWSENITSISNDLLDAVRHGSAITISNVIAPDALWNIVHANARAIEGDLPLVLQAGSELRLAKESNFRGVLIEGEVYCHSTARIGLGVVLDATDGPIIIESGVRILPNAVIMGPAVIGRDSIVKASAKIYEGTSVGPVCKVGGEIENSIFQGFSNKQHDGYVGHSYIGKWCNLGADTNTSDLKNDYSDVRVMIEGEEFNTASMFVGLLMGDHSKSAINSQFNTGTAVGVSCNLFDAGFPPKWIPSFSWGGAAGVTDYRFEKAQHVAEVVAARRGITLSASEVQLLRELYETKHQVSV